MNYWKCDKCKRVFSDKDRESEDLNKCPLCHVSYYEYEKGEEVSDYQVYKGII